MPWQTGKYQKIAQVVKSKNQVNLLLFLLLLGANICQLMLQYAKATRKCQTPKNLYIRVFKQYQGVLDI